VLPERRRTGLRPVVVLGALALLTSSAPAAPPPVPADHAEKMARSQDLFAREVRPLLLDNCAKCHGGDKTRGGLDLTSREALLKGSDNGPVVIPFRAGQSRLYKLAAHLEDPHMPPKSPRLKDGQLRLLAAWIDLGAAYDKPLIAKGPAAPKPRTVTDD